jgi:hypothetical protein
MIHEVVDDELSASLEQVKQARLSVGTIENVILFDPHHWQPAALRIQRVTRPGGGLFLGEQFIAATRHCSRETIFGSAGLFVFMAQLSVCGGWIGLLFSTQGKPMQ